MSEPGPDGVSEPAPALDALARLDAITRRLRVECPWDREQDERSIVPHTVEEAYELADAAGRGDDAKLLDELGDVLFQVYFLSLLLEERGAGTLAAVAEHVTEKLIRRHPHVFGEAPASTAAEVLGNWDRIKRDEPGREEGIFGEVPENLPSPLYARKVQRRAASTGFDFPGVEPVIDAAREELDELEAAASVGSPRGREARASGEDSEARASTEHREAQFGEVGDLLFAVVNIARKLRVDPELALRAASDRFRGRVSKGSELAALERRSWNDLRPDEQLSYYLRARLAEGGRDPR